MKKKTIIIIAIILLLLMLIPMPIPLDDGGTVIWRAVLYEVSDVQRFNPEYVDSDGAVGELYIEGVIIHILGFEVYNSVEK